MRRDGNAMQYGSEDGRRRRASRARGEEERELLLPLFVLDYLYIHETSELRTYETVEDANVGKTDR